jgi:hypothetical protein
MSVKNRAFAIAVGTAALIAASAPMASAASFAHPHSGNSGYGSNYGQNSVPNGFNNDSILNVSGNNLSTQACTVAGQSATAGVIQPVISALSTATTTAGLGATDLAPGNAATCTQGPAAAGSVIPTTTPSSSPNSGGFSNDSVLQVSNNQVQNQVCSIAAQTGTAAALQAVLGLAAPISSTTVASGLTPANLGTCSQNPAS